MVVENPSSLSVTQKDVKAMQAYCWWQCFKYQEDPDVLCTDELSEKIGLEKDYPFIRQEADNA